MTSSPDSVDPTPARVATQLEALRHSDQRLVRTVDSLTEEQWRGPSLLPDWSRAHVVAHLALNAEAFAGALEGMEHGEPVPIYLSEQARADDIEALSTAAPGELRERLFAATTRFRDACESLVGSQWDGTVHRVPDGPLWPAVVLPETRRREVEVHHADLDAGYRHTDWPTDFAVDLLDAVSGDHAGGGGPQFAVRAEEFGRTWAVGADDPVVTGTTADLGWWLTGRGTGDGLTSSSGELPAIGAWRRPASPSPLPGPDVP